MTSTRKFGISSHINELTLRKRELTSQLIDLRRSIIHEGGTDRKKRVFFRKHKQVQEEINSIEALIEEEKDKSTKQKLIPRLSMFHTPPGMTGATGQSDENQQKIGDEDIIERYTIEDIPDTDPFSLLPTSTPKKTIPASEATNILSVMPTASNTFQSYDSLKRMEAEEKISKLQKELKDIKEKYENMLKNNVLLPSNTLKPRRSLNFDSFELKKPTPKLKPIYTPLTTVKDPPHSILKTNSLHMEQNIDNPYGNPNENEQSERSVVTQENRGRQNSFIQQNQNFQNDYIQQNEIYPPGPNRGHSQNENENQNTARPRNSFLRRLKSIPAFNGGTYAEMRDLIDVVDTLFVSLQNQTEKIEFYDQLLLQIRGEARKAVESLDRTDWQAIREKLQNYFSYLAVNLKIL